MGRSEVDAALERLVSQFASPYDFLRELVQNSMDAGSDRVEVSLERHLETDASADTDAVFELVIMDTGIGMDETVIDGALTRLFASTKSDDRTMAGGFGVGFVSVFAWEPEVVLVQTGRAGEAWELTFYADRRFEKARLDVPVEGTTITLLRRADASAYPAVAQAVRDSLWRWCRYTEIEISFEDFADGDGAELILDAPTPEDYVVSRHEAVGDGHVRAAFGIPASAVMMRRGLILEEGDPGALIEPLRKEGRSVEHLALWVDSPELETTIARDSIVKSKGRERIEAKVVEQLGRLRVDLLDELEELCAEPELWNEHQQARYANLHAHLELEWDAVAKLAPNRKILRAHTPPGGRPLGGQRVWSPQEFAARVAGGPLVVAHRSADSPDPGWGEAWPVLEAERAGASWLRSLAGRFGLRVAEMSELSGTRVARKAAADESEAALLASIRDSLAHLTASTVSLQIAASTHAARKNPPLCAWAIGEHTLCSHRGLPAQALASLVLDHRHLLVQACLRTHGRAALTTRVNLLSAILSVVHNEVQPKQLQEHIWGVRERG